MQHDTDNGDIAGGRPSPGTAKIVTPEQLRTVRAGLAAGGRRLVQCHGCFDIVHPGHIRHLRQARSLGDVLLVTITADAQIAKGSGRPLIPEELRAENLAALDCVDYVCIDPNPTALGLLTMVRPDVYVKGKEYEGNNDPRFRAEREAVERAGGRVVFSSGDVVFSSTALIAALEQSADPYHLRLRQLAGRVDMQGPALFGAISAFRGKRLVVTGETIIDSYILCDRPHVASESPVMTLRPLEARQYDGGAAIIARHAAALGARPVLVTALPRGGHGGLDANAADLVRRLEGQGVEVRALPVGQPLAEKQRFLVGHQKMMKLDLVEPLVLDARQQEELASLTVSAAAESGGSDAAIIADFGLGLLTPKSVAKLCRDVRPHAAVLAGDVSGAGGTLAAMRGCDLLCPSEEEVRGSLHLRAEGLPLVAWRLLEAARAGNVIITLGADGLIAFSRLAGAPARTEEWARRLSSEHIPALCPIPLDPMGCGDSLLTVATLALAAGATVPGAAYLGAAAAAVQVQRLGNLPVTAADLRGVITRVQAGRLAYTGEETSRPRALARAG